MRTGDIVRHQPTGEEWVIAYVDEENGRLAWCGWPDGTVALADCELVTACTDDEHELMLEGLLDVGGPRQARAKQALEALGWIVDGVEIRRNDTPSPSL